ncbi:MAG: hypothetical protein D6767_03750 [Candidatus Hydrogenedentota bacterium]|nr:MAG: hypothetical protein D6767_03750 [Candidatus Hydrogenedentota bacterium]
MTYQLSHSPSLQPWNTRKAIRSVTEAAHRYFAALEQIGSQSYHAIATVHDEISETIKSSSYVLPHLRQQLIALSKNLNYNDSLPYDWKRKLIHEDTQYYELLEYSKYLLEKMQKFKNNPTKIFF